MKKLFFLFLITVSKYVQSVEVEFNIVGVPRHYTPLKEDIYLAGSFNNWQPNLPKYKFIRLSTNLFKLNIDLPKGDYQYKFTRGSWSTSETGINDGFMPNRNLQISTFNKQTHLIKINGWNDFNGDHSVTGNVYIIDTKFPYPQFNTTKTIWVYLPPDYYTSLKSYPVLYMHDAQNLFDKATSFAGEWSLDEILENNFFTGKQSSIIVGLETKVERMDELTPHPHPSYGGGKGDKYIDFLINYVKPFIDQNFRTVPNREFTGLAGSSLGGLMTFYGGFKNQNIFSKLGIFSPSFWFNDTIFDLVESSDIIKFEDTKFYFVCGEMEGSSTMVSNMLKMINKLFQKGYQNVKYNIRSYGTHSEIFWSKEFLEAFTWLFN
ncbi:T9SS C-terminal target domain-containing [Brachionus plicatilis]|uniref:T9SS C-terminal target domain-containing n=1 Tax=Brachionus plicatilis TaxID=10195 RepID=A0A3M7RHD5_BRAPC|nr:T9SS C-terminal target domain-containing [Brachionus plicatilis]